MLFHQLLRSGVRPRGASDCAVHPPKPMPEEPKRSLNLATHRGEGEGHRKGTATNVVGACHSRAQHVQEVFVLLTCTAQFCSCRLGGEARPEIERISFGLALSHGHTLRRMLCILRKALLRCQLRPVPKLSAPEADLRAGSKALHASEASEALELWPGPINPVTALPEAVPFIVCASSHSAANGRLKNQRLDAQRPADSRSACVPIA